MLLDSIAIYNKVGKMLHNIVLRGIVCVEFLCDLCFLMPKLLLVCAEIHLFVGFLKKKQINNGL